MYLNAQQVWFKGMEFYQFIKSKKFNKKWIAPLFIFGAFYSFAQTPGGVSSNLNLWLKADAGITIAGSGVSKWADQVNSNDFTQVTNVDRPSWLDNSINFNPSIEFDASNTEFMELLGYSGFTNNYSVFMVGYGDGTFQDLLGGEVEVHMVF